MGTDADGAGQDPTMVASTAHAPTGFVGHPPDAETLEAWSQAVDLQDPEPYTERDRGWRGNWLIAGAILVVGAGIAAVAAAIAVVYLRDDPRPGEMPVAGSLPSTTVPPSSASIATSPPEPTVTTVTVTSQPESAPTASYDEVFINRMSAQGWVVQDAQGMTNAARYACSMLHQGNSMGSVMQGFAASNPGGIASAQVFVTTAMKTYPNCP